MSQPAIAALAPLPFELVLADGEPLETEWHTLEYPLLRELIRQAMTEQGRTDFYVGGNMFVYYSLDQAREVSDEHTKNLPWQAYRGPDVFWVGGVDPDRERKAWISWEEDGRLPDVIVELLSPKTQKKDRTVKKDLYARVFRTAEYFLYEPDTLKLEGYRLAGQFYQPIEPDSNGHLWSEQLQVFLGIWHGRLLDNRERDWLRLFRPDGSPVPAGDELVEAERQRAEAERQKAEAERQRADAMEAEVARLRALLAERS